MASFYAEVIKKDKRFNSTKRVSDLALLEPNMRRKVERIIAEAGAHGLKLMAYETYRSQARQQELFDQGATLLRKVGVHHFGLACDLVKDIHGDPSWKGDFSLIGHLAAAHQLVWGGDWGEPLKKHTFIDQPHVQWCSVADQAKLFSGGWYPAHDYNPLA